MAYHFDFLAAFDYTDVLVKGVLTTVELIAVGGVIGIAVGIFGAWARTQGPRWLKPIVSGYVELIRNTPFLVQLFFIFLHFVVSLFQADSDRRWLASFLESKIAAQKMEPPMKSPQ